MAQERKGPIESLVAWASRERKSAWDLGTMIDPEQKGMFPFEQYGSSALSNWAGPSISIDTGTYGGNVDYAIEAGDLIDSSAAMACMLWVCRTFPEAPLIVKKSAPDGTETTVQRHAMARKIRRPNPHYSGMLLWSATLLSWQWNGNAYWRIIRNEAGQVLWLYYEPHWNVRPVRKKAEDFISNYQIWRDRKWEDVPTTDIVHFRCGLDPRNNMLGLSQLASALREVYTDNQAARFAAIMFKNKGQPGPILSPADGELPFDTATATRIKAEWQAMSTGDEMGKALVPTMPLKAEFPPSDPSKMDTRGNRRITEERISALLGVPAIVAGLGAGLDRSTFANMAEAREAAYEGNIIPTQAMFGDELDIQLLPNFGDPDTEQTGWDYTKVRVLQDDENKKITSANSRLVSGGISLNQYISLLGGTPMPDEQDVWYIPKGVSVVKNPLELIAQPMLPTDPSTNPQDTPQLTEGAPKGLFLPQGKAKSTADQRAEVEAELMRELEAELLGVYEEAARAA